MKSPFRLLILPVCCDSFLPFYERAIVDKRRTAKTCSSKIPVPDVELAMSDCNSNEFSWWRNTPDDSAFVHQAMSRLGFPCDFSALSLEQQRLTLALAEHFKRDRHTVEVYES